MARSGQMTTLHDPADIPDFKSEEEAVEFWDTHEISDDLWDKLPAAPPLVSPASDALRDSRWHS